MNCEDPRGASKLTFRTRTLQIMTCINIVLFSENLKHAACSKRYSVLQGTKDEGLAVLKKKKRRKKRTCLAPSSLHYHSSSCPFITFQCSTMLLQAQCEERRLDKSTHRSQLLLLLSLVLKMLVFPPLGKGLECFSHTAF